MTDVKNQYAGTRALCVSLSHTLSHDPSPLPPCTTTNHRQSIFLLEIALIFSGPLPLGVILVFHLLTHLSIEPLQRTLPRLVHEVLCLGSSLKGEGIVVTRSTYDTDTERPFTADL